MIKIITTAKELIHTRKKIWQEFPKKRVGFIPTMGNLHQGHLSLIKKSLETCDIHFISIFVNPKQFGPNEDYHRYPRTLEADVELIRKLVKNKKDIYIFAPQSVDEIYSSGFETVISIPRFNDILCGKYRPHHFDGVATVVYRLFLLIRPHNAFFGEKDYQQLMVIKTMTKDLMLPVNIVGLPIIRDTDGLALSSRNQYLSAEQRKKSLHLPRTLNQVANLIKSKGYSVAEKFCLEKMQEDSQWDYLEIREQDGLHQITPQSRNIVILGVYRQGATRLLDNLMLTLPIQKQIK